MNTRYGQVPKRRMIQICHRQRTQAKVLALATVSSKEVALVSRFSLSCDFYVPEVGRQHGETSYGLFLIPIPWAARQVSTI